MLRIASVCKVGLLRSPFHADSVLFCGSDKITRVSFTGQTLEQSFSRPILAVDTLDNAIALLLANGDAVFLSGSDLQETSRITIPSIDVTSICTLLWGDASHLLLGVASSSLHLHLLSYKSAWSSRELEPLCIPDTDRPLSSPWSLCFDASLGLFVASHAVSSELCLVSRQGGKWRLLNASDGENVCVPLNDCFEPLPVLRMAVVHEESRCFLFFAAEGEEAAACICREGGDDDSGENVDVDDVADDVADDIAVGIDAIDIADDVADDVADDDVVDDSVADDDDYDDNRNDAIDEDTDNNEDTDNSNDTTPDETPIPIDNEYQTLLPPPLSLPAAIPALRALRQQISHHDDHCKQLRDQLNSLPRDTLPSNQQRIQNAIQAETAVLEQLKEAKSSLRQFLEKSAESIRTRSPYPNSLRWDFLSRGFFGEERCAIVAPTATETSVVVQSLDRFFDEKPSSLHISFASTKERVVSAVAQKWRHHAEQRIAEVHREDVFASLEREEREKEKAREVAAAKEAARAKEEERKRKAEEALLKEKAEKEKKKQEEKERKEKEEKEKKEQEKKETPAAANPFAAAQSASGVSGTKENGSALFGKPSGPQPVNNASSNAGSLFNGAAQAASGGFGKKPEGNGGLFGKPGDNGGLFGKPAESGSGLFNKPAENSGGMFNKPAENSGGLFGKPGENAGNAFNKPAASNSGMFSKPAENAGKGGLFGQATEASGNLFGKPAESGSGLFNKPAESGSGLFNKPAENNGGLFNKPATESGLFNKPAESSAGLFNKPAASGGLFGSQGTQTFAGQQTQGGLFGSTNQQPAFGAPKGGLFAGQSKQVDPVGLVSVCHVGQIPAYHNRVLPKVQCGEAARSAGHHRQVPRQRARPVSAAGKEVLQRTARAKWSVVFMMTVCWIIA